MVKFAATGFLAVAGVTVYHTSVILDNHEYYFDSLGIVVAPPLWSHLVGQAKRGGELQTEVIDIGISPLSGKDLTDALQPYFNKGSYDLLYKNCNHFTDCALHFLTRNRLEGRFGRMERLLRCTDPISTNIMNKIFRAVYERKTGEPCDVDIYTTNPLAEDFTVDDVINSLEEDSESDDDEDVYQIGCAKIRAPPCCSRDMQSTSLHP